IIKPGEKELFKNGLIITSVRLLIHRNTTKLLINNNHNKQNNLRNSIKTTRVLSLRLTTVPIEIFNKMNCINATWIESWPPNNTNQLCPNIPLLLTNYDELTKIYILIDYNL
ncbi:unnamed protein product, partial [Schistosoma turkestanicum]